MFCRLLGGMVGDTVLTFGAKGGAFLAGGILPRIESLLKESEFEHCFKSKDVMSHYLEDINVAMITADDPALLGAAAWFYGVTPAPEHKKPATGAGS
jgi:glucokinase